MVLMNTRVIKQAANQSASTYHKSAFFAKTMADRLLARLDYIRLKPESILDLASGVGLLQPTLTSLYPSAQIFELDFSMSCLKRVKGRAICADVHAIPLASNSMDCVLSNNALYLFAHRPMVFSEVFRILKPGGLFMFTHLGPDTLCEWAQACKREGWVNSVGPFTDMHDIGDELAQAQFFDPVMDRELLTYDYESVVDMLVDRRYLGIKNIHPDRQPCLMTPARWKNIQKHMSEQLSLSLEVIYGHAWKKESTTFKANEDNEVCIPLDSLRKR